MIFKPDLAISIFLTVHVKLSNHGTEIWGNDIVIRTRKKIQCVNKQITRINFSFSRYGVNCGHYVYFDIVCACYTSVCYKYSFFPFFDSLVN